MKNHKRKMLSFVLPIVFVVFIMTIIIFQLHTYVKNSIHAERTNYLTIQTDSVTELINNLLYQYMEYATTCSHVITYDLLPGEDIDSFMDEIQERLTIENCQIVLVDSKGTWYGEKSSKGHISELSYYGKNTEDQLVYIATMNNQQKECFVFRVRLEEPIVAKKDGEDIVIQYCSTIFYLEDFNKKLLDAFPYEANSFIVDENGLMLYKNFTMGILIGGTNLFSKYERAEFLYYDYGENLIQNIKDGQTSVAEMLIDNHHYFICTASLDYNNWKISFVLDEDSLTSGTYIQTIFSYIIIMAVVFAVAVAIAGFTILRISTERRLLEKERIANEFLEKASQAKTEFFSNISHDIRTPINGIMGMTTIAKKQNNSQKTQDCLDKIEISSQYLLSLVNDVLDMSAIESGVLKISKRPLNIQTFVANSLDIVRGQLQGRNIELLSDCTGVVHPNVLADETHLSQIAINILGNSVKFTPDGGKISFRIEEKEIKEKESTYLLELSDTGVGMEKSIQDVLWDRFAQGSAGAKSKFKGTGLGMAITKKLVDAMDGTVQVESEVGKGTKFSILLTLEWTEDIEEEEEEEGRSIKGAKILVAEDNAINMEIITELLQQSGAEVIQAADGKIAVEQYCKKPEYYFDAILMDMMMPNLNGVEACKKIRNMERVDSTSVPIIAMTANSTTEDIKATQEAGMNAHLAKPINITQVVRTISQFYKQKERRELSS